MDSMECFCCLVLCRPHSLRFRFSEATLIQIKFGLMSITERFTWDSPEPVYFCINMIAHIVYHVVIIQAQLPIVLNPGAQHIVGSCRLYMHQQPMLVNLAEITHGEACIDWASRQDWLVVASTWNLCADPRHIPATVRHTLQTWSHDPVVSRRLVETC